MVWPEWQMKNEDLMDGCIIRHNIIIRHLSSEQPKFISIRNIIGSSTLPLNSFIPLEHNAWHLSDIYFKWLRRKINVWRINYLISTLYQRFPGKMCRDFDIFACTSTICIFIWKHGASSFSRLFQTAVSVELRLNCVSCVLKDVSCADGPECWGWNWLTPP